MQLRDFRTLVSRNIGNIAVPSRFRAAPPLSATTPTTFDHTTLFSEAQQSIIRLVEMVIVRACTARASDVHLDPNAENVRVRFRIDGVLQDTYVLPIALQSEIISRIKILSGLRIDEHFCAQDGRFGLVLPSGVSIDVRVSVVPTYYGENAVLRLLGESVESFTLESLGFTIENRAKIMHALARPYGMILTTGPTGSGKTTTMYTMLKMLNQPGCSIVTLEDPIEYSIPGVSQIQINSKSGLTFSNGLRSILRRPLLKVRPDLELICI